MVLIPQGFRIPVSELQFQRASFGAPVSESSSNLKPSGKLTQVKRRFLVDKHDLEHRVHRALVARLMLVDLLRPVLATPNLKTSLEWRTSFPGSVFGLAAVSRPRSVSIVDMMILYPAQNRTNRETRGTVSDEIFVYFSGSPGNLWGCPTLGRKRVQCPRHCMSCWVLTPMACVKDQGLSKHQQSARRPKHGKAIMPLGCWLERPVVSSPAHLAHPIRDEPPHSA